MGDFRKLIAWQESNSLAIDLGDAFPVRGPNMYSGLRDQLLRAAGSVPDCLAEGCGADSQPELQRFAGMAYKSAKEVESQLERARGSRTITEERYRAFAKRADRVSKLCYGLKR